MSYNWPLSTSSFTVADKLRVGAWLLGDSQWTQGDMVRKYEEEWEYHTGAAHCIMVASGSAANAMIALRRRHELEEEGRWPQDNKVVVPACTWISSVSPWVHAGFEPVFVDVSIYAMMPTADELRDALQETRASTVFITTLLGNASPVQELDDVCINQSAKLYLDNCESSFSAIEDRVLGKHATGWATHCCAYATSSTSLYFAHHTTTGTEGGLVFCQDDDEADWFRMMRSHGMTRGMPAKYRNPEVHPSFDFYLLGSNFRASNLQAYMASLDFDRAVEFAPRRCRLVDVFFKHANQGVKESYINPFKGNTGLNVPFALPIIINPSQRDLRSDRPSNAVRALLELLGIEHRPLIAGNLLRHTAFAKYAAPYRLRAKFFYGADRLHNYGLYVGLNRHVTEDMVADLGDRLAEL